MHITRWLQVFGVAAVSASVALSVEPSKTNKKSGGDRSRLLIYASKQGDKPASAALPPRQPNGNTGTVSPKTAATQKSTGRVVISDQPRSSVIATAAPEAKQPVAKTASAPFVDLDAERRLFEVDIQEPKIGARKVAPQTSTTPKTDVSLTSDAFDEALQSESRLQSLLESSRNTADKPAAQKPSVQQVSGEGQEELEVNPFEETVGPKVVHAAYKGSDNEKKTVQPVNHSGTPKPNTVSTIPTTPPTGTKVTPSSATTARKEAPTKPVAPSIASESRPVAVSDAGSSAPQVDVHWQALGEVNLGRECQCQLTVHNRGQVQANEIIVEANFPESVRLVDAEPFPSETSKRLEWRFPHMAAGEKKIISLTLIPTKGGELSAAANVRFTGTAATHFKVAEPRLKVDMKTPGEIHLGDPASTLVTISNPGTGTAHNVVLETFVTPGLESNQGRRQQTDIGPLGPGESRTVRLSLLAIKGGEQQIQVTARSASSDLQETIRGKVLVIAPDLAIKASGPTLRYINRPAKYEIIASNLSSAACDNVRLVTTIPAGFTFVSATHSGQYDETTRQVSWFMGRMEPDAQKLLELTLNPSQLGEYNCQFAITGDAGARAEAVVATRVDGAPSLQLKVRDLEDPVEVGVETAYEITVRNTGSKAASNVGIACELPADAQITKVESGVAHKVEDSLLVFQHLKHVQPGESFTARVFLKSRAAGSSQIRARLTSDSLPKPLIVEEATEFYGE